MQCSEFVNINYINWRSQIYSNHDTQMLYLDLQSHHIELQTLTTQFQEQELLIINKINSIISYDPAANIIITLAAAWSQLSRNFHTKKALSQKISFIESQLLDLEAQAQSKKQKIRKFKDKAYLHAMSDCKSINKLVSEAQKHSMKKIVECHVTQFVYLYINSSKRCSHSCKKMETKATKCQKDCQFGQLLHFIKQYKSQYISHKFKTLWAAMEQQLQSCLDCFNHSFKGKELGSDDQQQLTMSEKKIKQLKDMQMSLKVDLQIAIWEIKNALKNIGFPHAKNQDQLPSCKFNMMFEYILSSLNEGGIQQNRSNQQNTLAQQLVQIFQDYVREMISQYFQEHKINQQQINKYQQKVYCASANLFAQAFQQAVIFCSQKIHLKTRIYKLNESMQLIKKQICQQKCVQPKIGYQLADLQIMKNKIAYNFNLNGLQNVNRGEMSKNQISITVKSQQKIWFKVLKYMHISSISNFKSAISSKISSNLSSRDNSRASSRSPYKNKDQTPIYSIFNINKTQTSNERILEFCKQKLILKKENPHFREEIQIKRIKKIKIMNSSNINLYFTKGYMTLQLLAGRIKSHFLQCNQSSRKISMARQWVKCFRSFYCQYIQNIQFCLENVEGRNKSNDQLRICSGEASRCNKSQQLNLDNKQNIGQNYSAFYKYNSFRKQNKRNEVNYPSESQQQLKMKGIKGRRQR